MSPETRKRLMEVCNGNAGSTGSITIRREDYNELVSSSRGEILNKLEAVEADSRVAIIPVPLLSQALKSGADDEEDSSHSSADPETTEPAKPAQKKKR